MSKRSDKAFLTGLMDESLTPEQIKKSGVSTCPTCQKPYKGFVDDCSIKEYKISRMCQSCQDDVFGAPELPSGLPTGKCMNCGNMCYKHENMCSEACSGHYAASLKRSSEERRYR